MSPPGRLLWGMVHGEAPAATCLGASQILPKGRSLTGLLSAMVGRLVMGTSSPWWQDSSFRELFLGDSFLVGLAETVSSAPCRGSSHPLLHSLPSWHRGQAWTQTVQRIYSGCFCLLPAWTSPLASSSPIQSQLTISI